jgi:hypothetical protein
MTFRPDVASDEVEAQQGHQRDDEDDSRLGHPADQGGNDQRAGRVGGIELVTCAVLLEHLAGYPDCLYVATGRPIPTRPK